MALEAAAIASIFFASGTEDAVSTVSIMLWRQPMLASQSSRVVLRRLSVRYCEVCGVWQWCVQGCEFGNGAGCSDRLVARGDHRQV